MMSHKSGINLVVQAANEAIFRWSRRTNDGDGEQIAGSPRHTSKARKKCQNLCRAVNRLLGKDVMPTKFVTEADMLLLYEVACSPGGIFKEESPIELESMRDTKKKRGFQKLMQRGLIKQVKHWGAYRKLALTKKGENAIFGIGEFCEAKEQP